jgi:hypothetical protein
MSAQPTISAFTLGMACGSEGISVPPADCCSANSLLRSSNWSRLLVLILLAPNNEILAASALTCYLNEAPIYV